MVDTTCSVSIECTRHLYNILYRFLTSSFSLSLGVVQFMNAFDRAMNLLDDTFSFVASTKQIVSSTNEEDKVQMTLGDQCSFQDKLLFHTLTIVIFNFP